MRKMKYLLIIFLMFIGINSIKAVDTSLKVYDYAQVLSATEEANLKDMVDSYIYNHNMDMVLVTVKYHDKVDTMNYADDFYDYNGFGIGDNYDGVLFVIDFTSGNKDVWMSTTGAAIDMYTDNRIDSIINAVAAEKNNGYYEMFKAFINKTDYYANQGLPSYEYYEETKELNWLCIIVISLGVPSIIIVILILKNKMVKSATTATQYLDKHSVVISKRDDKFISTHTTSVRIQESSSSSGGSRGGSSTHRSSSGRSHGGGGRRL